jgi:hypothetical protein
MPNDNLFAKCVTQRTFKTKAQHYNQCLEKGTGEGDFKVCRKSAGISRRHNFDGNEIAVAQRLRSFFFFIFEVQQQRTSRVSTDMSLNPDTWTDKTQQVFREAKDLAAESSHVQLSPIHFAVRSSSSIQLTSWNPFVGSGFCNFLLHIGATFAYVGGGFAGP